MDKREFIEQATLRLFRGVGDPLVQIDCAFWAVNQAFRAWAEIERRLAEERPSFGK